MKKECVEYVTKFNLECRVDKDADGRITEEEIKEVWHHKFTTKEIKCWYFLVSSTHRISKVV